MKTCQENGSILAHHDGRFMAFVKLLELPWQLQVGRFIQLVKVVECSPFREVTGLHSKLVGWIFEKKQ